MEEENLLKQIRELKSSLDNQRERLSTLRGSLQVLSGDLEELATIIRSELDLQSSDVDFLLKELEMHCETRKEKVRDFITSFYGKFNPE